MMVLFGNDLEIFTFANDNLNQQITNMYWTDWMVLGVVHAWICFYQRLLGDML